VDANDPDALRDELLAALARAFRSYDPTGTPVEGGPSAEEAPLVGEGQYLDRLAPGDERFYAVRLAPGEKLFASVSAIPDRDIGGSAPFRARLIAPDGNEGGEATDVLSEDRLGQFGTISTFGLRSEQVPAAGVWKVAVQLEAYDLAVAEVPVELALQTLGPNESPGLARKPGAPGQPAPSPTASPTATPESSAGGGGGGAALAAVGGGGLLAGLAGGFAVARRRRS
jgi:Ca-activated chloride channel homolog